MPVNPSYTATIPPGKSLFRITSPTFLTTDPAFHAKVVDGQGGVGSEFGARYNYPGVETVYLTEDLETCFAEKMFYFHKDSLSQIDGAHLPHGSIPAYSKTFILWEITFGKGLTDVFDMSIPGALALYGIFPSLTINPSQDYFHLKQKRALIQSNGYQGLRAPSSRTTNGGHMIVLFRNQSLNVSSIHPRPVEFRLTTNHGTPFNNHVLETLDFTSGEVRILGKPLLPGHGRYYKWRKVDFFH